MSKVPGPKKLAKFLERNKISKTRAAEALGVTHASIIHWVDGDPLPNELNQERIEIWTVGEVSRADWETPDRRRNLEGVEPYRPDPEAA